MTNFVFEYVKRVRFCFCCADTEVAKNETFYQEGLRSPQRAFVGRPGHGDELTNGDIESLLSFRAPSIKSLNHPNQQIYGRLLQPDLSPSPSRA